MKTTSSIPRIYQFSKIPIVSFAAYSDNEISNGVIYLDTKKNARIVELPQGFIYDNNWPIRQIRFDETIKSVTYHETSNTYILSTFKEIDYDCIDEEGKPIVGTDFEKPKTKSLKGLLKLVSPLTWTVIDSIELADNEIGMNVESMILDVGTSSKRFKNKKEFIVLGTGKYRIEDLGANGSFKLYEIIDIIPEPGRPETNHKFKDFNQEDTRGAVTSICEISGRFLVAQGQKIIIRDIQDNGTIPVAFLDTSVYVSEAKSFGNLLLLGDSLKSVWLAGFDAEPFRMIMLGKDLQPLDVNCADFLTNDQEIHIVIADNNNSLHIVQYNPEDPGSSNGQRLLHKTAFNLNHSSTCMKTTPKHEEINPQTNGAQDVTFQTVGSTVDGSFYTVFPVNEATYRRMYILQQQLIDKEYHACGLNPRRNRFGGLSLSVNDTNAKPLLDYDVIKTFTSLNEDRKNNLALKVSRNVLQDIWKDFIEFECVLKHL
ncbi:mRNA cleavage and polyadenylation factor subunit [Cerrena zonata]|uniref:mRNA cleavage and polyadenylation factor subunit n=1 Tax=Cerrena zonata TaxID=2478898 RepID=A0AAW0FNE5_9APHY